MKWVFALFLALLLFRPTRVLAGEGAVLGVHILSTHEVGKVKGLVNLEEDSSDWNFVTIPLSLNDLSKEKEWQGFFDKAKKQKLQPVVRLVTRFEDGAWKVPNRKEVTNLLAFLEGLDWPSEKRYVIMFNEVNHAAEWGGTIDPVGYAQVFSFASSWARTQPKPLTVLPAALDLAAPNGKKTMEAFLFLEKMHQADPEIFSFIDIWNSHSYPNPGFSSSPQRTGKNSLRGFEHELAFLQKKTGKKYEVFISETGWVANGQTTRWLASYYTYALQHVWSHPQVIGVTPFVLKGDPGPFAGFGFLDRNDKPTAQYEALQEALGVVARGLELGEVGAVN